MSEKEIVDQVGNSDNDEEVMAERGQHLEEENDESLISATHSINPLSHSDLSNSSNWQNSGLTRSEVEFSRKKQGSRNNEGSVCSSSSSSMILKIKSNENSDDEYPLVNSTPRSNDFATTSNENRQPKELSTKSSQNSVSTSTSSTVWVKVNLNKKGQRQQHVRAKSKGIQTGHLISESIIRDCLKEKAEKHREKYQIDFNIDPIREKRQKHRGNENHRHDLSNVHRIPFKSLTNKENSNSSCSKSNINIESEMSPACRLVSEALRLSSSSQTRKGELLKAADFHRETHICKVRTEIQKLEILKKLLLTGKAIKSTNSKSSSTNSSESNGYDDGDDDSNHSNFGKRYYRPGPVNDKVDYRHKHVNFKSTQNQNKSKSKSSLSITKEKSKDRASTSSNSNSRCNQSLRSSSDGKIDKELTIEEKLEKLLSAFDKLTGGRNLVENSDSDEENYEETLKEKLRAKFKNYKKEPQLLTYKPSISYYVPIKKSLTSIETEVDETDEEFNKEKDIPNIQEAIEVGNQSFLNRAKEREKIIYNVKKERKRREEIKRNWAYGNLMYPNGFENNDCPTNLNLPPRGPAIMSVKEMKELTQKSYRKLPEVQEKIHQQIMDREKRTNRFMSQLFAHNLRTKVLKGQMNVEHYRSLIRN